MKRSRYKEEQIVSILREAESSTVTATARQHGVAEQTIYRWRRQFAGMEVSDVRELCQRQHKTDPFWCRNGNIKLTPLIM